VSLRNDYPTIKITTHRADMASTEQTQALVGDAAREHGMPVLVVVANAGVGIRIPHIK